MFPILHMPMLDENFMISFTVSQPRGSWSFMFIHANSKEPFSQKNLSSGFRPMISFKRSRSKVSFVGATAILSSSIVVIDRQVSIAHSKIRCIKDKLINFFISCKFA